MSAAGKKRSKYVEDMIVQQVAAIDTPVPCAQSTSEHVSTKLDKSFADALLGSDSEDESMISESSEPIVTIPIPAESSESARNRVVTVPQWSYFEIRSDKDKRKYIECFSEILGRIKTNYHFRCKCCGQSYVGQYVNMLVHLAGSSNHLRARTRPCPTPNLAVKNKIHEDFANYNAKEQYGTSLFKDGLVIPFPGIKLL